jgi:hypothetical protein
MFEQMLKVLNSVTIGMSSQLVDCIVEVIQGPCKDNQKTLVVHNKIIDSCREFINMLAKPENLGPLGFINEDPEEEDEDEELMG